MESPANPLRIALWCAFASLLILLSPGIHAAGEHSPRWVAGGQLTPQAGQLLDALQQVESYGLSHRDFAPLLSAINSHRASGTGDDALDELLNSAASRLVKQLHHGRVDPHAAGYALNRQRAPFDLDASLRQLATAPDVLEMLAAHEPRSSQYRALKQTLAHYRRIRTDLTSLPGLNGGAIEPGDEYAGSAKLRWLLAELGDAPAPRDTAVSETLYDDDLVAAVARFQRRHGLVADGVIGARTFAALTAPISQRIRQIELTMERWRWMPALQPPAVIVNVPQYMLYTLPDPRDPASDSTPAKMPVIVGQSARQTPIFDSEIESVIIRPYWNVPTSILREELLPLIQRDPAYLARHDMEIVRGDGDDALVLPIDATGIAALRSGKARLRQRPGPANALGLIKFVLPNPYSVFLHSTPEAQLFSRERRALSHGCIRVSDASALAAYLLRKTQGNWDVSAIEAATCGTQTFTIRLARPVPVFILYGTVVVDTGGEVLFFDDVYGYDRVLDELLRRSGSALHGT